MNPNMGRFWTMDGFEGDIEDPFTLHKYIFTKDNPANCIDPGGRESFVGFQINMGFNKFGAHFGHAGLITHNPTNDVYTVFFWNWGKVSTATSKDKLALFNYFGVVFVLPDSYDLAIDTARTKYVPTGQQGSLHYNCMTESMKILTAAGYPYPYQGAAYPNEWAWEFWHAGYAYHWGDPADNAESYFRLKDMQWKAVVEYYESDGNMPQD